MGHLFLVMRYQMLDVGEKLRQATVVSPFAFLHQSVVARPSLGLDGLLRRQLALEKARQVLVREPEIRSVSIAPSRTYMPKNKCLDAPCASSDSPGSRGGWENSCVLSKKAGRSGSAAGTPEKNGSRSFCSASGAGRSWSHRYQCKNIQ